MRLEDARSAIYFRDVEKDNQLSRPKQLSALDLRKMKANRSDAFHGTCAKL